MFITHKFVFSYTKTRLVKLLKRVANYFTKLFLDLINCYSFADISLCINYVIN